MAGETDLGALMPGGSGGGEAAGASSGGWTEFLKSPFFQGMAQQLAGGYSSGGVLRQIGPAVAKGMESQNLTNELQYQRQEADQARGDKLSEGAANRASHEKVAGIAADSRNEVAQTRTEGMLQRAALIHGPQNNQEMNIFSKARSDYFKKEKDNQLISKKSDQQITQEADAWAKEQLRGAREATGVRSQGQALPGEGAASTSAPPASGSPTAAPPGGAAQPAPAAQGTPAKPTWEQLKANPTVQKYLQSSAGRAAIKKERPELAKDVDMYEALLNSPQSPGM